MKIKKTLAGILSFTLLFGAIPADHVTAAKKISMSKTLSLTTGKTKTLKVKNTKKKVKWKIVSGKKYISIKKKGKQAVTVKGTKKGTAKIRATVDKKKLTCKVTVKNAKEPQKTDSDNTPVQTAAAPVGSVAPVGSTAPSSSAAPGGSVAPGSSSAPGSSAAPDNPTETPDENQPGVSAAPDSSVAPGGSATPDNSDKNADDVAALQELIRTQRANGAIVDEDINNKEQYTWENGRLVGIDWAEQGLSGSLDVSRNTALEYLGCGGNQLSSLDVSNNTALRTLMCGSNQLSSLDVSHNTALEWLDCSYSQLGSLDLSNNIALSGLFCSGNQLSSLDVSHNTALTTLFCYGNQLSSLDVSNNTALESLGCDGDVTIIGYSDTSEKNEEDEAALRELIRTQRESGATVREDIGDKDQYKWENGRLVEIDWEYTKLSGKLDVTLLSALKSLNCSGNELTSLDVSRNTALESLGCSENQLSSLDVSHNTALKSLGCRDNQLTSLDLSNNTSLKSLECDNDVTIIGYSDTSEKNADDMAALEELIRTQRANGATVNEDINSKLQYRWENGRLVRINWVKQGLSGKLDVTPFSALQSLWCESNQLSSLDVSNNTALTYLNCSWNQLSSLDVSHNTALKILYCNGNQLSSLDLTYNTKLEEFDCDDSVTVIGYSE